MFKATLPVCRVEKFVISEKPVQLINIEGDMIPEIVIFNQISSANKKKKKRREPARLAIKTLEAVNCLKSSNLYVEKSIQASNPVKTFQKIIRLIFDQLKITQEGHGTKVSKQDKIKRVFVLNFRCLDSGC